MPSNPSATAARFNEVAAVAAAEQIVKRLHNRVCSPTGKVYTSQREERLGLWTELLTLATEQGMALKGQQTHAKRSVPRRTVPTVAGTGIPITQINVEAAQETA